MKILHINLYYREFGGAERYLLDICAAQEERDHEVVVVSSNHEGNIRVGKRAEYFIEPSFGLKSGKRMYPLVEDIVKKEAPDIIHLHGTLFFLSPYIEKRLIRLKPVVRTIHNAFFFVRRRQRSCLQVSSAPTPWALNA